MLNCKGALTVYLASLDKSYQSSPQRLQGHGCMKGAFKSRGNIEQTIKSRIIPTTAGEEESLLIFLTSYWWWILVHFLCYLKRNQQNPTKKLNLFSTRTKKKQNPIGIRSNCNQFVSRYAKDFLTEIYQFNVQRRKTTSLLPFLLFCHWFVIQFS